MKLNFYKFSLIILFGVCLFIVKVFAIDIKFYQGFDKFNISDDGINFVCNNQCVIGIDELKNYKKIKINGNFSGTGKVGLAFLINNRLFPVDSKLLNNSIVFYFTDLKFYNQIPKNSIISLVFLGNIRGNNVKFKLSTKLGITKIIKDFFKIEGITPYIINFKYGGKIFDIPEVKLLTYLGLILILLALLISKTKFKTILYIFIILTSIIYIRNLYEYIIITKQSVKNFQDSKPVFYLNDYYAFIKNIRNLINFNNCTYDIISYQNWPFAKRSKNVYLKPCEYANIKPKYVIIYKDKIPQQYINCKVVYNKNNNLLLKCK